MNSKYVRKKLNEIWQYKMKWPDWFRKGILLSILVDIRRIIMTPKQFDKKEVLLKYPEKAPIRGAHTDVNRMLTDRGLTPIYKDSDEEHHKVNKMQRYKNMQAGKSGDSYADAKDKDNKEWSLKKDETLDELEKRAKSKLTPIQSRTPPVGEEDHSDSV